CSVRSTRFALGTLPEVQPSRSAIFRVRSSVGRTRGAFPPRSFNGSIAMLTSFLRGGAWLQRHRKTAQQAFGAPVEFGLTAKLRLDAGDHASCAKSTRCRFLDRRSSGLFPCQPQQTHLASPLDR